MYKRQVLEGSHHERAIAVLREFTDNIEFVDPTKRVGVPTALAVNPVSYTHLVARSRCCRP